MPVIIYTHTIFLESLKHFYIKDYDFAFHVPPESKARAFNVFVTWKDFLPPRFICAVLLRFAACLCRRLSVCLPRCRSRCRRLSHSLPRCSWRLIAVFASGDSAPLFIIIKQSVSSFEKPECWSYRTYLRRTPEYMPREH